MLLDIADLNRFPSEFFKQAKKDYKAYLKKREEERRRKEKAGMR